MPLFALKLPPGIHWNGTEYQSQGRWYDANLVRFFNGTIRPFGGWVRKTPEDVGGPGRGIIAWRPSSFQRAALIGTPDKLWLWNESELVDVTPAGFPAGIVDSFYGVGFGHGNFGEGPFGISGSGESVIDATTWIFDTWGDHVVAVATHDRKIYEYLADESPAVAVSNAPSASALFVTNERNLVAVGTGSDRRQIQWSDHENHTIWAPAPDNAAGDWRFQTSGLLVTGRRVGRTHLVWSSVDLFRMDFIGGALVYRFEQVADQCGLIGPNAMQVVGDGVIWMGHKNFYAFAGGQVRPVPCDIHDFVFRDINRTQAVKISAGSIAAFGEVLFSYCSAASSVVDRCVSYNVQEKHWNIVSQHGHMARGCWADVGAFPNPLAVGNDGRVYEQESGWTNDGVPLIEERYVVSGPVEMGDGSQILEATQLVPDELTVGSMQVHFVQRFTPNGPVTLRGPYAVTRPYVDVRVTARQVGIRLEALADEDWRFGTQRLLAFPGGER